MSDWQFAKSCLLFFKLGISFDGNTNPFEHQDIHIHFPAGGVGKDGPSAGITITIALVSLVLEKLVQPSK